MAEGLVIRAMTPADIDAVMAIEYASFTLPWSRASMEAEARNRAAIYLVGEDNGAIVAYGGGWLVIDEAHITTLAVLPRCRRRGYGRAIINALLDAFAKYDIGIVLLEARVSNHAAIALYKSIGFERLSTRRRYYDDNGEDAAVMLLEMRRRRI